MVVAIRHSFPCPSAYTLTPPLLLRATACQPITIRFPTPSVTFRERCSVRLIYRRFLPARISAALR